MLPRGALRENLATLSADATEPSRGLGFRCKRGCFVELSGTNPQAILRLGGPRAMRQRCLIPTGRLRLARARRQQLSLGATEPCGKVTVFLT